MLNYITSMPASDKLRQRMKDEVLRQYEMYRTYQQPDATIDDFFSRHAAAVRHIIDILASFAQLNVMPLSPDAPVRQPQDVRDNQPEWEKLLMEKAGMCGLSLYAKNLLLRFYHDFLACWERAGMGTCQLRGEVLVAALLSEFVHMNGMEFMQKDFIRETLGVDAGDMKKMAKRVRSALHCETLNPSYLTEEGFVRSIYVY
jgi:hypothetical protein